MKNKWKFFSFRDKTYLLIIFQTFILLGIFSAYYLSGIVGNTVYLKTNPIDFVRVDFVEVEYPELTASLDKWKGNKRPIRGEKVYILFKRADGINQLKNIYKEKPKAKNNETIMRAKIKYVYEEIKVSLENNRYYLTEKQKEKVKIGKTYIIETKQSPFGFTRNMSIKEVPGKQAPMKK